MQTLFIFLKSQFFLIWSFFNCFSWRIIGLKYCVGFCHMSTWISHNYKHILSLLRASLVAQMVNLPEMWETWVQSLGQKDPLEKEMAIHSSILAWRIPWAGESDWLQSMGSQSVGHNLAANAFTFTPSWTSLLPPTPSHSSSLSQSHGLISLNYAANSHWLSVFTYGSVYVSMLLSPYIGFYFFIIVFIYFWMFRVFVAVRHFFSCGEQGLYFSCGAWASPCCAFSCCRAWALGCCSSCRV